MSKVSQKKNNRASDLVTSVSFTKGALFLDTMLVPITCSYFFHLTASVSATADHLFLLDCVTELNVLDFLLLSSSGMKNSGWNLWLTFRSPLILSVKTFWWLASFKSLTYEMSMSRSSETIWFWSLCTFIYDWYFASVKMVYLGFPENDLTNSGPFNSLSLFVSSRGFDFLGIARIK